MKRLSALFILSLALMFILSADGTYAFSQNSNEASHGNASMNPPGDDSSLSGKVLETMDSGGYTYVQLEKNGNKIWVAVPKMKVTVGEEVSFAPGMVMNNFTSKTLDRTFETIVFSSGTIGKGGNESETPSGHGRISGSKSKETATIKIDKASGPDAYTVAELHEKSADLHTKSVTVRGKVVKVSPEIMGKNWIHIQDGTGDASNGTNDMLVTSKDLPSVGDVITAKGTLLKDKDFGSGYKYSVMMEEASINK